MSKIEHLEAMVAAMRERGIDFAPGLSERELHRAEEVLGAGFPPDLSELLRYAMPRGERFPDWRHPGSTAMAKRLAWPAEGIAFDIEHNDFWLPDWGKRPQSLEEAQARARCEARRAPVLIPVYGHRYLPATPCREGNPVFSVYQTDILYYGHDLPSYLSAEFDFPNAHPRPESPRKIELWTRLVEWHEEGFRRSSADWPEQSIRRDD